MDNNSRMLGSEKCVDVLYAQPSIQLTNLSAEIRKMSMLAST